MSKSRSKYLINRLISGKLSKEELGELLAGLGKNEVLDEYADILEKYFHYLVSKEGGRAE